MIGWFKPRMVALDPPTFEIFLWVIFAELGKINYFQGKINKFQGKTYEKGLKNNLAFHVQFLFFSHHIFKIVLTPSHCYSHIGSFKHGLFVKVIKPNCVEVSAAEVESIKSAYNESCIKLADHYLKYEDKSKYSLSLPYYRQEF